MARAVLTALLALQIFGERQTFRSQNAQGPYLLTLQVYYNLFLFHCKNLNKNSKLFSSNFMLRHDFERFQPRSSRSSKRKRPRNRRNIKFLCLPNTHMIIYGVSLLTSYRTTRLGHLACCFNC
jgi:hypothetical protein